MPANVDEIERLYIAEEWTAQQGLVAMRAWDWPEAIGIADSLLTCRLDPRWIHVDEGGVTFTLTNGSARYTFDRRLSASPGWRVVRAWVSPTMRGS